MTQRQNGWLDVFANSEHTETMTVDKLEMGEAFAQFCPKAPDPEIILTFIGIMEQHDSSLRKLRLPTLEIVPNCLVGVEVIHV
jgi:hypothetical protein